MEQDLFTYLPSEAITEILSRVPAQTILCCKRVCKSWYDLVSTREFVKLHVSKSVPGLAVIVDQDSMDKIIEHINDLHFSTITKLYFAKSECARIKGSVDGLLLLSKYTSIKETLLFLCNPINRECIDLHHCQSHPPKLGKVIYGFGVSKISGQYKVLSIFHDQTNKLPESECKVYTIGTGSWRSIAPHVGVRYNTNHRGLFVNGNLHWLVKGLNGTQWISCFDVETELFTTCSLPLGNRGKMGMLFALNGSLCVCEDTCTPIWLMKEYGVDKSWTKEFVIRSLKLPVLNGIRIFKIVFKDGTILKTYGSNSIYHYFDGCVSMISHSYTPSSLSLKCFRMENSKSINMLYADC